MLHAPYQSISERGESYRAAVLQPPPPPSPVIHIKQICSIHFTGGTAPTSVLSHAVVKQSIKATYGFLSTTTVL